MKILMKLFLILANILVPISYLQNTETVHADESSDSIQCADFSLSPIDENNDGSFYYNRFDNSLESRDCVHKVTKHKLYEDIEPSITILTHGLGGDPSHWANNNISPDIGFDSESLPEKIQSIDSVHTSIYLIDNNFSRVPASSFTIETLSIDSLGNEYLRNFVDLSIHNLSPKVIILFKSSDYKQHNIIDYLELNYIIDLFSYKYLRDYEYVPKVNLIGHSRGGLTNIQYVNEHPLNVDSVFSIDTPYYGSEFGQMTGMMNLLNFSETINSCGGQDILDTGLDIIGTTSCAIPLAPIDSGSGTLHQTYREGYEEAHEVNSQIKAHAIGTAITLDGILHVLA